MELRKQIVEALSNYNRNTFDYMGCLYISLYKELPHCYRVYWKDENTLEYLSSTEPFDICKKQMIYKFDYRSLLNNLLERSKQLGLIIHCYSCHEYLVLGGENGSPNFLINITLGDDNDLGSLYEEIYCKKEDIETVFNMIKPFCGISKKEDRTEFGITAVDSTGALYTSWYDYINPEINIEQNYNDDLPYDHICNIVNREGKPDLMLFYGDPGTGKSSFIKHLICTFPNKEFVFLDGGILINVQQDKLMSYFLENQNTIFILEDCEKALTDREHNYNPIMPILLNITDGIIGDILGIKLICTFNTSLRNIDPALLRKGRLSLKYEFKKLEGKKVEKILGKNVDMCLADIYNYEEENDFSKKNTHKIGF